MNPEKQDSPTTSTLTRRVSPDYRDAIFTAILLQLFFGLSTALILDGGYIATVFLFSSIGFWAGTALILIRRPKAPTAFDIDAIKWGTFFCLAVSAVICPLIRALKQGLL